MYKIIFSALIFFISALYIFNLLIMTKRIVFASRILLFLGITTRRGRKDYPEVTSGPLSKQDRAGGEPFFNLAYINEEESAC